MASYTAYKGGVFRLPRVVDTLMELPSHGNRQDIAYYVFLTLKAEVNYILSFRVITLHLATSVFKAHFTFRFWVLMTTIIDCIPLSLSIYLNSYIKGI